MIKYDTLYHVDENDNVRIWFLEQEGNKYRSVSGVENGKLVISAWKEVFGKNTGKSNATSDEGQATAEIKALYKKKLERKYHTSKDTIDSGSKIIEPMLADKYKKWDPNWKQVYSQPKLDGMRCLATKYGLFTRQGKKIISCPHIEKSLSSIFEKFPHTILDGELYNHDLKDNFNELISIAKQLKPTEDDLIRSEKYIQYHVYDAIYDAEFFSRSVWVTFTLASIDYIVPVETHSIRIEEELDQRYAEYLEDGYEGQMIRLDTLYEHKRTKSLLKRKEFIDDEFQILDIEEGLGNWSGYAKSVKCITKDGIIFNAGIKGNQEFTKELLTRSPRPKTATIRYQNITPDGSLRFPVAVAFYEGDRDI